MLATLLLSSTVESKNYETLIKANMQILGISTHLFWIKQKPINFYYGAIKFFTNRRKKKLFLICKLKYKIKIKIMKASHYIMALLPIIC